MTAAIEVPVFPADLMKLLGGVCAETLRAGIKSGKIPPPDVRITQKTRYWHRATLVAAGLLPKPCREEEPISNRS